MRDDQMRKALGDWRSTEYPDIQQRRGPLIKDSTRRNKLRDADDLRRLYQAVLLELQSRGTAGDGQDGTAS